MTAGTEESIEDFLLGSVIANRYRIDARLAKGGMATVYRATDLTLNRVVAIKLLRAPKATDDPGRITARFRLEAESLARLNHRHIVTVYDYGETEDGGYFLAMEYVDGPSLSALIRHQRLAPERAVRIILQVCKALRYAHKRGIVHRDLKPGNILLAREEEEEVAKLVDFGLVKLTEEDALTQHGLILGTVHCMAPEQIRGGKIDPRADLYAIGVVLFRLVVGQYPFHSKQTAEVLAAHLHAQIPTFSSFDPNLLVPPGLEEIVRKCLQKSPAARYESATELIQDLAACLRIPPDQFVSVSLVMGELAPLERTARRNVLLGALAGLGGLGVLGAAALVAIGLGAEAPHQDSVEVAAAMVGEPQPPDATTREAQPPVGSPDHPQAEGATEPEPAAAAAPQPEPIAAERAVIAVPEPVAPRPAPRPKPRPAPAPASVGDAIAEVEPASPPEPAKPAAAVLLQDIAIAPSDGQVVVTLKMSNGSVRPLAFSAEGSSAAFPKQYQVVFKGGASGMRATTVPVGHELVESVNILERSGALTVVVNSRTTPNMAFQGSGPDYRVVVSK